MTNIPKALDPYPKVGDIFWLLKEKHVDQARRHELAVRSEIFNHPVLIVSVNSSTHVVNILILTSLGQRSLRKYSKGHSRSRQEAAAIRNLYLPISPSPVHPDNGSILHLENNVELFKLTYVNIKQLYQLPCSFIGPLWQDDAAGYRTRLQPSSFEFLIRRLTAQPPIFPEPIPSSSTNVQSVPVTVQVESDSSPTIPISHSYTPALSRDQASAPAKAARRGETECHWEEDSPPRATVAFGSRYDTSSSAVLTRQESTVGSESSPTSGSSGRKTLTLGILLALGSIGTLTYWLTSRVQGRSH